MELPACASQMRQPQVAEGVRAETVKVRLPGPGLYCFTPGPACQPRAPVAV